MKTFILMDMIINRDTDTVSVSLKSLFEIFIKEFVSIYYCDS